jgi:hypothetical protein
MKSYLALSFTLLVAINIYAQKGVRESYEPTTPIIIDGNVEEWSTEWMVDSDGKFLFNIGNNQENLYIRIKISDDLTQQKIASYGLFVKMDVNGKKKGKLGVKYPVGKDARELKQEQPPMPQDIAGRIYMKKQMLNEVEVLELLGLSKENIVSSRLGLMNGIELIILANDQGHYVYEAKIPFKAFRIDKSKTPILGITIETGKMDMAKGAPAAPNGGAQQGANAQRNFAGSYNEMMIPSYMWVGMKLK